MAARLKGGVSSIRILNYRIAQKSDAEKIAQLHADSWRRTYRGLLLDTFLDGDLLTDRLDVWNRRLGDQRIDQLVLVAENQKGLLGFICVYGNENPSWGSLIDNLHVTHEHKGSGVGTLLMRQAGSWLKSNYGGSGVYLWVMEANDPARRFYEKLGATNAGIVEKENPGGDSARNCRYVWSGPEMLANGS